MGSGEVKIESIHVQGAVHGKLLNTKDEVFSIMKGIAIISVVIGHTIVGSNVEIIVNHYHLATFFFVSGFYDANDIIRTDCDKDYIRKDG